MGNAEKKRRRIWPFVVIIILLILIIIGMFFYFTIMPFKSNPRAEIENPIEGLTAEEAVLQFDESYVDYLVFAIGGWKLHNPPLSSETPKIESIIDDEVFASEIIDGEIRTEKKEIKNEDMVIRTTREEVVNSILSLDMEGYIRQSVQERKISLELKASKTLLFSKGYLSIYQDIAGESFTGSVVKIFRKI